MAASIFRKIGIFAIAFIFILTLISASEAACVTELDCPGKGGPWPIDVASYITYDCINSACVAGDPIYVECLSDNACPIGYKCDTEKGKCILTDAEALASAECVCEPCPQCEETDYTLPLITAGALIAFAIVFCFSNFYMKRRR